MKLSTLITIGVLGSLLAVAGVLLTTVASVYNRHVTLTSLYDAKLKSNHAEFDNLFKKLSQSAQVTDMQKDALRQIFNEYATARTTGGAADGSLMKWIKEVVPNVDVTVYKNLQNLIVTSRDSWTRNQNELVDVAREYNVFIRSFPNNLVAMAFGWKQIDAKVITSTHTEQSFETGVDDSVDLKNLK